MRLRGFPALIRSADPKGAARADMKTKHRRELKENEVAQLVGATREFLQENGRHLTTAVVAVILVVAAGVRVPCVPQPRTVERTGAARAGVRRPQHRRGAGQRRNEARRCAGGRVDWRKGNVLDGRRRS
jgi:hypothetical protein